MRRFKRLDFSVTNTLLAIQVIVFIVMTLAGGSQDIYVLITFGAKVNTLVQQGQYWRLLTPIFLHIGFMHLLLNGISQYYLGNDLEKQIGKMRFLLIYFLSGIMGNIFSFAFTDAISAGASTAIFGLFATYIILGRIYPSHSYFSRMGQTYTVLIVLMLVQSIFSSGVDLWGHLGGFVGGVIVSLGIFPPEEEKYSFSTVGMSIITYLIVASALIMIGMR